MPVKFRVTVVAEPPALTVTVPPLMEAPVTPAPITLAPEITTSPVPVLTTVTVVTLFAPPEAENATWVDG